MTEKRRQTTPTFPDVTPEQRQWLNKHERLHEEFSALPKATTGQVVNVPPTPSPKKYFVHWGYMQSHTEEFTDFQRALDHFADHKGGPSGARLVGEGYDADHDGDGFREVADGLTDAERERVEEIQ